MQLLACRTDAAGGCSGSIHDEAFHGQAEAIARITGRGPSRRASGPGGTDGHLRRLAGGFILTAAQVFGPMSLGWRWIPLFVLTVTAVQARLEDPDR